MPSSQLLVDDWHGLAQELLRAGDPDEAFDAIVTEVSSTLQTRACIVQRVERGWRVVAQARGGLPVAVADLPDALNAISFEAPIGTLDLRPMAQGVWTSVPLADDGRSIALLVAGEETTVGPKLSGLAVWLPLALGYARERETRRDAERLTVEGYKMARRISRLGGVEAVCQHVVEQVARSIRAQRIGLAIHRPDENRLAIAATYGYPADVVKDVRIEPGAWVMGHVYASGRPLLVTDIRRMRGLSLARRPYRTFSFAVVPILAGRAALGVLSATDKADGSAFDRQDSLALRTLSRVAALGLLAARSDAEAHRLAHAATVDSLTGLFNRPYFDRRLHQEVERARRTSTPVTVLIADIDDFKAINDTYGHPAGDAVLHGIGNILRSAVRVFDVCSRYGGDEFAILMPGSDRISAVASAERIRKLVSEWYTHDEASGRAGRLTISIGVAVIEAADDPADLIRRADDCLYRAKADGKNCVRLTSEPSTIRSVPPIRRGMPDDV